jgi:hypothetical protein
MILIRVRIKRNVNSVGDSIKGFHCQGIPDQREAGIGQSAIFQPDNFQLPLSQTVMSFHPDSNFFTQSIKIVRKTHENVRGKKRRGTVRSLDCQALNTPNASWNTGFAGRLTPLTGKNCARTLRGPASVAPEG